MVKKGQFGVNRICQLTGISKATYYAAKNPKQNFEDKYLHLKKYIREIIKNNGSYGIVRIKKELLEKYNIIIGKHALGKLLKLWSLDIKRKVKAKKPNMIKKILITLANRANLLIRTDITAPFQAVTSDITNLKFKGGTAYWCVHKDALGQMVYGWNLSMNMKKQTAIQSLKMTEETIKKMTKAKKDKDKIKKIIVHQDRGSQYTSHSYVQKALNFFTLSYSNPGTPTHNAGQESFFGRFKQEWADEIAEIETFEKLEKFVKEKIKYYNYKRRHTSIGLKSPWDYTKQFL
ncbi:hypothetical protein COY95_02365 [Candidatus Woesearchaeota archaeon CG_4_10_14_0_8_um_filter_47_5]|nr:MAG: hypothetical protein COY95_02365 [Candidatus Woesearchaeota archaeon CG_4_10_14_0_8_um_filter_47_5]